MSEDASLVNSYYQIGGGLEFEHPTYVKREADRKFLEALEQRKYCYILNARQMGKSSLLIHTACKLEEKGIQCPDINLMGITSKDTTEDEWYKDIIGELVSYFLLEIEPEIWWKQHEGRSPVSRFKLFIENELLSNIPKPIVILFDEIDRVLSLEFRDDFFALIRSFYDKGRRNPQYKRLTFAFLGVAAPNDLIKNKKDTIFDVGIAIELTGFQEEQVEPLANGLKQRVSDTKALLKEVLQWTGGQPFLTQKLCALILHNSAPIPSNNKELPGWIEQLVKSKIISVWETQDELAHFNNIRRRLLLPEKNLRKRLEIYKEILKSQDIKANDTQEHLELQLTGLVAKKQGVLNVYNPIYKEIFNLDWVNKELAKLTRIDWGNAPEVSTFVGRSEDLQNLKKWIVDYRCRIVAIVGIAGIGKTKVSLKLGKGGIGKTDLSVKVADEIKGDFEYIIWRSLLNAPPLTEILNDTIDFLGHRQETNLPNTLDQQISLLLDYLEKHRCLLLLDNVESILQGGDNSRNYKEGYEKYGELFRQVADKEHKSCLLLTSREQIVDIDKRAGSELPVRYLRLSGLNEVDGREIIDNIGYFQSDKEEDWKKLIEFYNGNPLALEIVGRYILSEYSGNISNFIRSGRKSFQDLYSLLDWHFSRFTKGEKEIMYWLSINREAVSDLELIDDFLNPITQEEIDRIKKSLRERIPLEVSEAGLTLQPVLIEYMTRRIIEEVCEEIRNGQTNGILNTHALLKAQGKDYIKDIQKLLILQPILDELLPKIDDIAEEVKSLKSKIPKHRWKIKRELDRISKKLKRWSKSLKPEEYLKQIVTILRTKQLNNQPGYAAGNVINLLCQMKLDLCSYNFSNLTIWQADLQGVDLHNANFADSNLAKCCFTQDVVSVTSVVFSKDGQLLVVGDGYGTIHVWDISSNQKLLSWKGHADWIWSLAISPDGKILASGSADQTVKMWNIQTRQCLDTLAEHKDGVWSVIFSPDGNILASGSGDKTIKIWDTKTLQCLDTFLAHDDWVWSIALSDDGKTLASGSYDNTIKIWDLKTRQCKMLGRHSNRVWSVAFSPDGKTLASGSGDKTIKIWDTKTLQCLNTFVGHDNRVRAVAFSPDGKILASGSEDHTIRLWSIRTGDCFKVLRGHTNWIRSVAFSPDGKTLASGSGDQTVCIWDISYTENPRCLYTLKGYTNMPLSLAFSCDGKTFASGSEDHTIRIWDLKTYQCQILGKHSNRVWSVAFSPDLQTVASGSEDHTVRLWNIRTGQCLDTLVEHTAGVWSVAFSPDGKILASGSEDNTVRLWNLRTGQCLGVLPGHTGRVRTVVFSPDGETVASGSEDYTIKIWDIHTCKCLRTLLGHNNLSIAFIDEKTLVSGSEDHNLRLWNIRTGDCLKLLQGHTNWVWSVASSPDGQILASGGDDQTVRLWDIRSGDCLKVLESHTSRVFSVAFSPNSLLLSSGSEDETIKLWDVRKGNCIETLSTPKLYYRMNITGITGLTEAQKNSLKKLGAIEIRSDV